MSEGGVADAVCEMERKIVDLRAALSQSEKLHELKDSRLSTLELESEATRCQLRELEETLVSVEQANRALRGEADELGDALLRKEDELTSRTEEMAAGVVAARDPLRRAHDALEAKSATITDLERTVAASEWRLSELEEELAYALHGHSGLSAHFKVRCQPPLQVEEQAS